MPDADVIARAAIELVADGSMLTQMMKETFTDVEDAADTFAANVTRKLIDSLGPLSEADIGQFLAESAASAGQSIEQMVTNLNELGVTLGTTKEGAVAVGEAYKTELGEKLTQSFNSVVFELKNLGAVTPATAKEFLALGDAAKAASNGNDQLNTSLKSLQSTMQTVASGEKTMKAETTGLGKVFEKLGIPMSDASKQGAFLSQMLGKVGLGFATAGTAAIAAFGAFKIFSETKKIFDESINLAIQMSEVNFRLEVAVRASQRAIGDQAFSIEEAKAQAQGLSDTYGQSIVSMTDLVGTAVRTTSEMNLTKEQVKDLTKAAVVMNETMGIDSKSALMQISMFMQSGYGRALSRNGFAVSRAAQQQQAYAMGIRKSLKDMTEAEKQAVRYALVMRQVDKYSEDAAAGQTNLAKKLAHSAQEAEEARVALGAIVAPQKVRWDVFWQQAKTNVVQGLTGITTALVMAMAGWAGTLGTLAAMVALALKGETRSLDYWLDVRRKSILDAFKELITGVDTLDNAMKTAAEGTEEWQQAIDDALTELEPELQQFVDDFLEAMQKLQDEFEEDFAKTFDDTGKAIAKADKDRVRDLRDIDEAAAEKRIQTTRDYQNEELRDAQDHHRAMRDMEVQYLFDLQDAVRERDARGVLLLQRRYNLEKSRAEEEYRVNSDRRKQDFQDEMLDIERQRQLKRFERNRAFDEERADLLAQGEVRRAELKAQLEKDKAELQAAVVKSITDAILELVKSGVLSAEQAMALGKQWGATLGGAAGAAIATAVNSALYQTLTAAAKAMGAFYGNKPGAYTGSEPKRVYSTSSYSGSEPKTGGYYGKGFAVGGDFIATAPQMIQVGERPERVSIQPLNRATGDAAGTMGGAGRRGGGGKVEVAIALSEGLEGNIVDQAMAEVADVFVTLNRGDAARGAGGRR